MSRMEAPLIPALDSRPGSEPFWFEPSFPLELLATLTAFVAALAAEKALAKRNFDGRLPFSGDVAPDVGLETVDISFEGGVGRSMAVISGLGDRGGGGGFNFAFASPEQSRKDPRMSMNHARVPETTSRSVAAYAWSIAVVGVAAFRIESGRVLR